MSEDHEILVERLFEAFNRRDAAEIAAVCDEGMEFYPEATAEAVGRSAPYVGGDGLREYMADTARVWEELQITPGDVEQRGERLLVRGRAYARSRELGIRDIPVAWIWQLRNGRFIRGQVYLDAEEAAEHFSAAVA
ncbi:MAG TPA: nuclear transport factor 2 family protein [Solirubrobacterales bacterium]